MTSQEKVRELIDRLAEWTAETGVGGGLITGLLHGMSEEFEDSFPAEPETLDLYLLEVAAMLLTGRSDDAEPMAICRAICSEGEDRRGWVPVTLASEAIEGSAEEQ